MRRGKCHVGIANIQVVNKVLFPVVCAHARKKGALELCTRFFFTHEYNLDRGLAGMRSPDNVNTRNREILLEIAAHRFYVCV